MECVPGADPPVAMKSSLKASWIMRSSVMPCKGSDVEGVHVMRRGEKTKEEKKNLNDVIKHCVQ